MMAFVIMPIRNNSDGQEEDDHKFPLRAYSALHSLASSMQQSPRCQKSNPHENRALIPLPQLQSHTLPTTLMPRQRPELPNPKRDFQTSNSNTPQNLTGVSDEGKIAHFGTKVKEKYKRNNPDSSLRKLEKKDTKTKTIY